MMKRCSKCEEEKIKGMFAQAKSRKDGLDNWCRSCRRDYRKKKIDVVSDKKDRKIRRNVWLSSKNIGEDKTNQFKRDNPFEK